MQSIVPGSFPRVVPVSEPDGGSDRGLASFGATQSRLSTQFGTISVMRQECSAASSRIADADIAQESAAMVRQQILQQAGAARERFSLTKDRQAVTKFIMRCLSSASFLPFRSIWWA